jgi:hypothetical protein
MENKLMPIEAPICLLCGTRHWSTQPCPTKDKPKAECAKKAVEAVAEIKPAATISRHKASGTEPFGRRKNRKPKCPMHGCPFSKL